MDAEQHNTTNTNNNSNIDSDKCQKLKRFVIVGLLITIGILSWHFYEYFQSKPLPKAPDDVLELSKSLYAEETAVSPFLYKVNLQGKTTSGAHDDKAPKNLFELHQDLLVRDANSTTALLLRLFDNYELDVAVAEHTTSEHEQEQHDFLRTVMNTRMMKLTMKFLVHKDIVSSDYDAQLRLLQDLWFTPYSRGRGIVGSSSFEHVFMAEIRDQKVLGLHNWLYFADQEQRGNIDYKGWLSHLEMGKPNQISLSLRNTFHGIRKPVTGFFVGTSPELEMSLYTACFLATPEEEPCHIQLGHARVSIVSHSWSWKGKRLIATAYPDNLP
ncbi:poly(U)-specific endoribonuclease homolog [Drosophila guanche]|uniref:Blast:Poly(U)-specific endoribonuclease homolog n=1 Tax=Drosophila guanche TaxID=7266 RepID=A0A3B0K874_DROGU|nr:poly(U)-specific endoribonuclease homolog [Drosophila guanche]SPP84280.1 blast:Poly(U)-specific endoribonuclease homolog [Drosophila guanche]